MSRNYGRLVLYGVAFFLGGVLLWQQLARPSVPITEEAEQSALIPVDQIVEGGPGKDGIPSIDDPKFISVAEAEASGMYDGEGLGISLTIGETTRFYPFQILVWHEIVNDTVNDVPVAVTYCPLCGTGITFDRRIDGEPVEFGVSGKLYQSDLLMYDRKTDSLWAQIEGLAVIGPLVGARLQLIDAPNITWGEFQAKHPTGQVLSTDTGHARNYQSSPYGDYDINDQIYFPINHTDDRLHLKARVLGVELENQFKAYPVADVLAAGTVMDEFAGRVLRLEADGEVIIVTDAGTGEAIVPVNAFWFAWATFHPGTELYQP